MSEDSDPEEQPRREVPTILGNLGPDEMLARGMQTVKMTGGPGSWEPPSLAEAARLFPGYEVLKLLGRGGMGAVYQARQIQLDRVVAIKLLPLEISVDKDFAERFRREARAMARLHHPNIVTVFDFGTTPEGHLFFVMEYVEGANLSEVIREVGLNAEQVLAVIEQVCTALAFAHGRGVVHRDIKPANVMIDTESHVKVADFGLARLTDLSPGQTGYTMTGTIMGTPDYMAPEQMKGMDVDQRADIYSVGVMLYEMICREVPKGIFDPPSHRTGCDARIDAIVMKAMHQSPERRYQSTQEMRSDIVAARTPPAALAPQGTLAVSGPTQIVQPRLVDRRGLSDPEDAAMIVLDVPLSKMRPKKSKWLWIAGGATAAVTVVFVVVLWAKQPKAAAPPPTAHEMFLRATREAPFINSLGMKCVPVEITGGPSGGQHVLFSIWETRVQDYEAFVKVKGGTWPKPPFAQEPTHPVVNVNWHDAQAFCAWLTEQERAGGRIGPTETYRLPTDHEWSCAVGIGERELAGKAPVAKSGKITDVFPWGSATPPPPGTGNFSGEEAIGHEVSAAQRIMTGYRDNFPETAPVGSFAPNRFGLYDLGGNAWEWCDTAFGSPPGMLVLRGSGFDGWNGTNLLSSYRDSRPPGTRGGSLGFRVVLAPMPVPVPPGPDAPGVPTSVAATARLPYVNTLGMRFLPVPIAGGPTNGQRILFSTWETRVRDYEIFAAETKRQVVTPNFEQEPTHPAVMVSVEDAQAFCVWLTERERGNRLGVDEYYRLPTDHEWSCAVGIGEREEPATAAVEKNMKILGQFPWGTGWPPAADVGNLSGAEIVGNQVWSGQSAISGYRDEFPCTSPVGSFAANNLGLYDLAGNVWEWADGGSPKAPAWVLRGGSFECSRMDSFLSSFRDSRSGNTRAVSLGFRVVIASESAASLPGAKGGWVDALEGWRRGRAPTGLIPAGTGFRTAKQFITPVWMKPPFVNQAARVTIAARPGDAASVSVRVRYSEYDAGAHSTYYEAQYISNQRRVVLRVAKAAPPRTLMDWSLPATFDNTPSQTIELRAIGNELSIRFNGSMLGTVNDNVLPLGSFALVASPDTLIERFEYLDLGGVASPVPGAGPAAAASPAPATPKP